MDRNTARCASLISISACLAAVFLKACVLIHYTASPCLPLCLCYSLPAEWGSSTAVLATSLKQLYLHRMQLTGEIPYSWYGQLPAVTQFTVWGNKLCGQYSPQYTSGITRLCLDSSMTQLGEKHAPGADRVLAFLHDSHCGVA